MINPFKPGDEKHYRHTVSGDDLAVFPSGEVHPFYATFAVCRDAEWAGRLFVLEMKEEDEEGIGTFVNVQHHAPATRGDVVDYIATLTEVHENKVFCSFNAKVGDRLIASGSTGQMILKRHKLEEIKEQLHGQKG